MEYSTRRPRFPCAAAVFKAVRWSTDPEAQVAELTGILRVGPGGDRLATWPTDLRVIARRVPRPAGKQAKLGEDANWEYGAFATNTATC